MGDGPADRDVAEVLAEGERSPDEGMLVRVEDPPSRRPQLEPDEVTAKHRFFHECVEDLDVRRTAGDQSLGAHED